MMFLFREHSQNQVLIRKILHVDNHIGISIATLLLMLDCYGEYDLKNKRNIPLIHN